ncbi:AraC family transcriptional regulator [Kitasatospora indigofera]|uniref:AraC family transcriptional regulator n=1 Tax=Kitasatospora indigofera TaxID=67307 RepID=UPI0033AB0B7D
MLERLNQVMDHIESGLDGRIDVAELARIATTSEYHLRRMFSALAGMPLSEYVRRRRLTVAGAEVLAGPGTLLEIAVRYGYASGEAFARAFRAMHGVGPGEARRTGAALRSQPRMSFRLVVEGSSSMRYRIAQLSDQEPAGIVSVTDNLDESRAEGTGLDYWHAALTRADPPQDLDALLVPAGTWAVFENTGPFPQALQYLWRDVYTQWFPSNPYRSRPGPEILGVRPSPDGSQADAQLWIPVERGAV